MKNLAALACLIFGTSAFAGGMLQIPVQLLKMENHGRIQFARNALAEAGLLHDKTVRYSNFQTIVVGGDEAGSNYKGALFIYRVKLDTRENEFKEFECYQFLSVGNFEPKLTRPIVCKKL